MPVPSSSKHCATCQYWQGDRVLTKDGRNVDYRAGARGVCTNFKSIYNGKLVLATAYCTHWGKWSMIR